MTEVGVTLIVLIVLLLVLLILILFLFFKIKKIQKDNILLRQQLLLSQLNPHFVFNSLSAIQSFMFRSEAHLGSKYLASFAKLTRLILENSRTQLCSIEQEINTITHYLELQQLRFDNKFSYRIVVDDILDKSMILIPPMLTQPFIENSIEHGFIHMSEEGLLTVSFKASGPKHILIEIEDNGIGIELGKTQLMTNGEKYKSLATKITRERIEGIRKSMGLKVELNIIDLSKENPQKHGTLVTMRIPINHG